MPMIALIGSESQFIEFFSAVAVRKHYCKVNPIIMGIYYC